MLSTLYSYLFSAFELPQDSYSSMTSLDVLQSLPEDEQALLLSLLDTNEALLERLPEEERDEFLYFMNNLDEELDVTYGTEEVAFKLLKWIVSKISSMVSILLYYLEVFCR